jgi:inner membrane protein
MIYFHAFDHSMHHHRFWTHIPAVWLVVTVTSLALAKWLRPSWVAPLALLLAGVWLHLVLDTWAGDIMWLWPVSDQFFHLFAVPATQSHWVLSFLLHWTFLAEIVIIAAAVYLYFRHESP